MLYTIFDYIDSILFTKKRIYDISENDNAFNFYMINRWISMYSPEMAEYINLSTNSNFCLFNTKQEQYDFLFSVMPRIRKRKISYIKKTKEPLNSKSDSTNLEFIAKQKELSKKELMKQFEFLNELNSLMN